MTSLPPQNFDYFFVLDFEATCWKNIQLEPQEIIEFPCHQVNATNMIIESTFHRYVRPVHHPNLSHFCIELTGITQDMVAKEADFPTVFADFNKWLVNSLGGNVSNHRFTFVTCGDWDLRKMLPSQCATSGLEVPEYFRQWINIKKSYHSTKRQFPRSMAQMMNGLNLTFEGRPHSGIDDSTNIVRILKELALLGHVYNVTPTLQERTN